jgi:hypothetical protein
MTCIERDGDDEMMLRPLTPSVNLGCACPMSYGHPMARVLRMLNVQWASVTE